MTDNDFEFQSTLSVRRATISFNAYHNKDRISIHALRKESDICHLRKIEQWRISIHALRKESD